MAIADDGMNVTVHRFGCIDTSAIEFPDIGIVDNPSDIAFSFRNANTFHARASDLSKTSSIDVAFGIIIVNGGLRLIESCQVKLIVISASDRHGWMWRTFICIVLVTATMELLEPHVASYMEIFHTISGIVLLSHPLLNDTSLQNVGFLCPALTVFKLSDAEKGCVGHLEPSLRLHDTKVIRTLAASGLLRHTETYHVQEIVPDGMET